MEAANSISSVRVKGRRRKEMWVTYFLLRSCRSSIVNLQIMMGLAILSSRFVQFDHTDV